MFFLFVAVLVSHNINNKITNAQVSIVTHGSFALYEPLVLECQITSFSGGATWSHDNGMNLLTQCFSGGLCTDNGSGNYIYSSNVTGIFVTIVSLTTDEQGITWTCSHSPYKDNFTIPEPGPAKEIDNEQTTGYVVGFDCVGGVVAPSVGGMLAVCTTSVVFTIICAELWYFSNQYIIGGTVMYGIQMVIVAAFCQLFNIISTAIVLVIFNGQYDDWVIGVSVLLISVSSWLSVFVYYCIVRIGGPNEWIYKKFSDKSERFSLGDYFGKQLRTTSKIDISFKVKASKDAHLAIFGQDHKVPLVNIILGYRDALRSAVLESFQVKPKDEHRDEVLRSDEYKTFYLKIRPNDIKLFKGRENEEPILTWKSDKQVIRSIGDIQISNNYEAMINREINRNFTKQEQDILLAIMKFENGDIKMAVWQEMCSKMNAVNDHDHQRTVEEIMEIWNKNMASTKGIYSENIEESFLTSNSKMTETCSDESGTPAEWVVLVRQGDRLSDKDDYSRSFQTCLLVCVVLFPIAWLVMLFLIFRYIYICITDTNGKGSTLSSVLCCQNSVKPKPKAKEDRKSNEALKPENVWINTPMGRKVPDLPAIEKRGKSKSKQRLEQE